MKKMQKINLVALSTTLSLLNCAPIAHADSKIYANGSWIKTEEEKNINLWNNNALFNSRIPSMTQQLAERFVDKNNSLLGLRENITLNAVSINNGKEFNTVRFQKKLLGLEVIGGETLVHISNDGIELVNTDTTSLDAITVIPQLSSKEAQSIAFASYQGNALSADDAKLKVLISKNAQGERESNLVYEVTVRNQDALSSDIHFINAHTGQEVLVTSNVQTIKNRKIMAGQGSDADFNLDESTYKLVTADAGCNTQSAPQKLSSVGSSGNLWADYMASVAKTTGKKPSKPKPPTNGGQGCAKVSPAVAQSAALAFQHSGTVYDYYQSTFNRDSIDGKGMLIESVVNFGNKFDNAAWINDKSMMIYGMGDGNQFGDFASALDVAGHELTHGITARTAALQYAAESGALNESYSDIFGKFIDIKYGNGSSDWKIGKELFKGSKGFIRDMENPEVANTKDFKYRGMQCSQANDYCGVHDNSGIPSLAAVKIIKGIGNDKAAKLYFLTLTQLLRSSSDFKEAKAQTQAACAKLYGASGTECKVVADAFASVGI